MKSKLEKVVDGFESVKNNLFFRSVRDGMVMALPILMVGSIAVMLGNLPFPGYKDFITTFAKGSISIFLNFIQNATFGILSVYITLTISIGLINNLNCTRYRIPAVLSAISVFFIFEGIFQATYDYSFLGAKGMFSAIIAGFCATYLFVTLSRLMKKIIEFHSGSTDSIFTEAMNGIIPFVITIVCNALFNLIFVLAFNVNGFNEAFVVLARFIFHNLGTTFFSSFLFLFCIHVLWLFGIHGNNVMEPVAESLFLFDGQNFLCKPLFDVFCLAGGSGATWCYILAVLIFCKRKRDKKLEYLAILPSIFNINELVVFGTPVIFNPVLAVPFVLTPLLFLCTTYFFYRIGFLTKLNPVEWTTPYFLSGYFTTGSWRGVLVQFINLVLGTGLYFPFVKINEKLRSNSVNSSIDALVKLMQESEKTLSPANLTNGTSNLNIAAKYLSDDLKKDLDDKKLRVYYQGQYKKDGTCLGAESLLRWYLPSLGMIYPPLICQLAKEGNYLMELEKYIFNTIFLEMESLEKVFGDKCQISINVTGKTIQTDEFQTFLIDSMNRFRFPKGRICIEITEQDSLPLNDDFIAQLYELKKCGYMLAIDDFSMGHTSIAYLKTNLFDEVKLDGSLVKDMVNNDRCKEIINSISFLSQALKFKILAEYVETEEQQEMLAKLNVHDYQGFLYAKALPLEKLLEGNIE